MGGQCLNGSRAGAHVTVAHERMNSVSDLLVAGLAGPRPVPPTGQYVVPAELAEALDEWMQEFIRQVGIVAPKYLAFLKAETGRGFKLFKTFLTDNGKVVVRFDPAKRSNMEFGPMVVLRVGYSNSSDLYDFQVEVYNVNVAEKLGSHETAGGDVELLADPARMLYGVRDALSQLKLRKARTENEDKMGHASQLEESLTEETDAEAGEANIARYKREKERKERMAASKKDEPEKKPEAGGKETPKGMKWVFGKLVKLVSDTDISDSLDLALAEEGETQDQLDRMKRNSAFAKKAAAIGDKKHGKAPEEPEKKPGLIKRGMKMVFGKWAKVEGAEAEGPDVYELDETLVGTSRFVGFDLKKLDEANVTARLNLGTEGGTFGDERTNPTKSGPAAERANVLRQAKYGIEKMREAVEVVREWVGKFNLGDQDKTGSAAAALRLAAEEIEKVESRQGELAGLIEVPQLDGRAILRAATEARDALASLLEKTAVLPGLDQARGGLARLMEGLRQIHGMLRQAKLGGRILDQVEAAIKGLKMTRDALVEAKTSKADWEAGLKKDEADLADLVKSIKTLEGGGSVKNLTLAGAKKTKSSLEAAIANKKKLIGGLDECGGMIGGSIDATGYGKKYERAPAGDLKKGSWIQGGVPEEPTYRQVVAVEREENAPYVVLVLDQPYVGSDGQKHTTARFHNDALVPQAS